MKNNEKSFSKIGLLKFPSRSCWEITTDLHPRLMTKSWMWITPRTVVEAPQRHRNHKSARPFISSSAHILREPLEAAQLAPRSMIPFFFFFFFPRSAALVVCLGATGQPYVRKPSNVLLMFNPFVGKERVPYLVAHGKKSHCFPVSPPHHYPLTLPYV